MTDLPPRMVAVLVALRAIPRTVTSLARALGERTDSPEVMELLAAMDDISLIVPGRRMLRAWTTYSLTAAGWAWLEERGLGKVYLSAAGAAAKD